MTISVHQGTTELAARGTSMPAGFVPVALGWATVDLDRVVADLVAAGVDRRTVEPAPDDEAMGALARRVPVEDGTLLLLEPRTEGRLAAALARYGEGPVALYVRAISADISEPDELLAPMGDPLGGRSRMVRPAFPWGPFVLYHQPHDDRSDDPARRR